MATIKPADVQPGDRLARWTYTGAKIGGDGEYGIWGMTVIRVNPKTYTVRHDGAPKGEHRRIPHDEIVDRADWPEVGGETEKAGE